MRFLFAFTALSAFATWPALGQSIYKSVTEFGASGADSKDDTAAIKSAIAAVNGSENPGGTIFFPAGKYLISEPLLIEKSGVTLLGEGRGSPNSGDGTVLVQTSTTTGTAVIFRGCRYSGLRTFVLTHQGDVPESQRKEAVLKLDDTYHVFAREVYISGGACGVEIVDGISPLLEDIDIKGPSGAYGIWLHGSGGKRPDFKKVDAALFYRVAGSAESNDALEWIVIGPNVDGAKVHDARFVAGSRGLVLRGGTEEGDTRPKYVYTDKFGCDHVQDEGVLIEAGNDLFMVNTWIGQNKNGSGIVIGPKFTGMALITNVRVRGSGGHGLHIQGGENIYISNPVIGACATSRARHAEDANPGCGVLIEAAVKHLRITGGGVGPLPETGDKSQQHYGVRYLGTDQQARENSVRISGVDTVGNPVPFAPPALSLDKE